MLLQSAPEILAWLMMGWSGEVEWDRHNLEKLSKHGFSREEVERVLTGDLYFAGEVLGDYGERRFVSYGKLADGRYMTIAWTPRGDKIRPISCRRSRDEEKKRLDCAHR